MIIAGPDPWSDLSTWMQRRQMVEFCLKKFDMGDSKDDVEALVHLIDLGLRARLRLLYDVSLKQSIDTIPMPRAPRRRRRTNESPDRRQDG